MRKLKKHIRYRYNRSSQQMTGMLWLYASLIIYHHLWCFCNICGSNNIAHVYVINYKLEVYYFL